MERVSHGQTQGTCCCTTAASIHDAATRGSQRPSVATIMPHYALSIFVVLLLTSAANQLVLADDDGGSEGHHGDSVSAPAPAAAALSLPSDPAQACALSVHRNASDCGQAAYAQYAGEADSPGAHAGCPGIRSRAVRPAILEAALLAASHTACMVAARRSAFQHGHPHLRLYAAVLEAEQRVSSAASPRHNLGSWFTPALSLASLCLQMRRAVRVRPSSSATHLICQAGTATVTRTCWRA